MNDDAEVRDGDRTVDQQALDIGYEALLWISEYPNREGDGDTHAVELAEYAREALSRLEAL